MNKNRGWRAEPALGYTESDFAKMRAKIRALTGTDI